MYVIKRRSENVYVMASPSLLKQTEVLIYLYQRNSSLKKSWVILVTDPEYRDSANIPDTLRSSVLEIL